MDFLNTSFEPMVEVFLIEKWRLFVGPLALTVFVLAKDQSKRQTAFVHWPALRVFFFTHYLIYSCTNPRVVVLEADTVVDLAGGSGASQGQEKSPVRTNANFIDSLPGPRGRGAGGFPFWQPHQTDPLSIQSDLEWMERKLVRLQTSVHSLDIRKPRLTKYQ